MTRQELLESIAATTADYRNNEMSPEHVDRWVKQFDKALQKPILAELDHVLKKTYVAKKTVFRFLKNLLTNEELAGNDPCTFWSKVAFLNIQGGGNSQREMLAIFQKSLQQQCDLSIQDCGKNSTVFVYLDDAIFTGNRVLNDIRTWIQSKAPKKATLHIVVIALHLAGQRYAEERINGAAKDTRKAINLKWWYSREIEDREEKIDVSDVLRPTSLPNENLVTEYVNGLKYAPILRTPGNVGEKQVFSSETGRHLLEQEFLKAGVRIRSRCPYLNKYQRPLGNMVLETLGFGSLLVTFRNCPNNCPLAIWAGDPWYPLFPRKVN